MHQSDLKNRLDLVFNQSGGGTYAGVVVVVYVAYKSVDITKKRSRSCDASILLLQRKITAFEVCLSQEISQEDIIFCICSLLSNV